MELSKAILNTLAYFNFFDYPLTMSEVWQFLFWPNGQRVSLEQVATELEMLRNNGKISLVRGFYCCYGREQNIEIREDRHRLSIKKIRLARREAQRLSHLPSVLGVAVSNSLSLRNSRQGGDIDFFVITKNNAVWQTRGITAGYAAAWDKRPHISFKENKLCLCLFAAEQALDLEEYLLPEENNMPDVVRIYWMATLKPLIGNEAVWEKFYRANQWVNKFLPNLKFRFNGEKETNAFIAPAFSEKILSHIQIKLLPDSLKQKIGQGSEVVTSFGVIKLHQNNGRREIRDRFMEKYMM